MDIHADLMLSHFKRLSKEKCCYRLVRFQNVIWSEITDPEN